MCFAPQRHALFRHVNFQEWSEPDVFYTFLLGNVLCATTACTFSTSQLLKVLRSWGVLYIFTSKCARATAACNFSSLIWPDDSAPAALASLLFDPPEPQIIGKTQWIATSLPFRAPAPSFFSLFLRSSHFLSSPPWRFPPLVFHLSILSEVLPSIHVLPMDLFVHPDSHDICSRLSFPSLLWPHERSQLELTGSTGRLALEPRTPLKWQTMHFQSDSCSYPSAIISACLTIGDNFFVDFPWIHQSIISVPIRPVAGRRLEFPAHPLDGPEGHPLCSRMGLADGTLGVNKSESGILKLHRIWIFLSLF